jgi:hypothetical protein
VNWKCNVSQAEREAVSGLVQRRALGEWARVGWQTPLRENHTTLELQELLGFLGQHNILPKYGFPVDTVDLRTIYADSERGADTRLSRDLRMAIYEYAPVPRWWLAAGSGPQVASTACPGVTSFSGAGNVLRIGQHLSEVLARARKVVSSCECGEETSCYACLRTFRSERFHDQLRRGEAATLLAQVLREPILTTDDQAPQVPAEWAGAMAQTGTPAEQEFLAALAGVRGAVQGNLEVAPGSVVLVRDEEWLVRGVESTADSCGQPCATTAISSSTMTPLKSSRPPAGPASPPSVKRGPGSTSVSRCGNDDLTH